MADTGTAPPAIWSFTEHEHRDLMRGINGIHDVACDIGGWLTPHVTGGVGDVLSWIDRDLAPHLSWEEAWLFSEIDALAGTPWATRSARFDHDQIRNMVARVRTDQQAIHTTDPHELLAELRCHLFGLEALLRAHLEREERYLIPLLSDDRSPEAQPPTRGSAHSA
jgi:iron-sulfur cluster repair protein YtfE (RIC family)